MVRLVTPLPHQLTPLVIGQLGQVLAAIQAAPNGREATNTMRSLLSIGGSAPAEGVAALARHLAAMAMVVSSIATKIRADFQHPHDGNFPWAQVWRARPKHWTHSPMLVGHTPDTSSFVAHINTVAAALAQSTHVELETYADGGFELVDFDRNKVCRFWPGGAEMQMRVVASDVQTVVLDGVQVPFSGGSAERGERAAAALLMSLRYR